MDTKLADSLADRPYVAGIAERQVAHPRRATSALARASLRPESHSEKILVSRTSIMCKLWETLGGLLIMEDRITLGVHRAMA